jgi:hypothetical protein
MEISQEQLDEIDRNARAYGFEIGRGKALTKNLNMSDDNPFLESSWRDNVQE